MIRRTLGNRSWQVVIIGVAGAMCALLGVAADQWRLSVLGLVVVALASMGLSLLIWRAIAKISRGVSAIHHQVAHAPADPAPLLDDRRTASLLDDHRIAKLFDHALTEADVPGEVERRFGEALKTDREEMTDLIRLVLRHDAARVSLPLDSETSPSSVLDLLRVMDQMQPDRTLMIGSGAVALWAAHAARGWNGRTDVVCSLDGASELTALIDACGLSDQLRALALPLVVPAISPAVRPWWDLAQLERGAYDLVAFVPGFGGARPAIPALPLVLDRVRQGGGVVIVEAPAASVVGPSWTASADTVSHYLPVGREDRRTTLLAPAGTHRTDDELAGGDRAQ